MASESAGFVICGGRDSLWLVQFAVSAVSLRQVAAGRAALRRAGAVFHGGVVLVAVAAGLHFAFAAVALARGAEALGGIDERGGEEGKRSQRHEDDAAEWGVTGAENLRTKKATFSVCSRRGGPAELMAREARFGERKL